MTDGRYTVRNQPKSESEMAALIATELRLADNDHTSEIIGNASDAYRYLLLRPKGDEEVGKSQVQDGAVADVIDSVMAELQPLYTVDELVEVKAEGPDDEDQAKAETAALNWYFRERLKGYERLDEAMQDALLVRNAFVKIWPETSWRTPYETTLEGTVPQIELELAQLIQQGHQVKEYEDRRIVLQDQLVDVQMVPDDTGLELVPVQVEVAPRIERREILVIQKVREIRCATIAREDFGVSQDAVDQNLQYPRFCYHRRRMTRNQAVQLGFYQPDIWNLESEDTTANQVNSERKEGYRQHRDSTAADSGGDIISIYECYYLVDQDGDSIAERHQIFYGRSNRILRWAGPDGEPGPYADEIVRTVPIASGIALRVAHRHLGRSLFDKLKNTEDIKRLLKRQLNDNLYQANDREFIIGPGASEDDFELGFNGGYKRCQNPQTDAVPVPYNPIVSESLAALNYYDSVRSERGGAALDNAGQEQPTNIQARTFERWMTATERTSAMYARNFADMVRDVFILLHMALKTLGDDFDYQEGEEWKKAQPRFWIERERFSVKLGKSEGERARLIANYENQIQKAGEALDNGGDGVITSMSQIYELLTDQANLMGVENHWLDPDRIVGQNPQTGQPITAAQQAQMARSQAAQEQQAAQERAQDKVLAAQQNIVAIQEQTKRLEDLQQAQAKAQETIQKGLDSIRDFVNKQTELEVQSGEDIVGGVLYGDEELEGRVTQ